MTSLAVVGASPNGIAWTNWLMNSLALYDFDGEVRLVNPKYDELFGLKCYPNVASLPEDPDIGVLMTGANRVAQLAGELLGRGCRRFVIVSNGFAEAGTEAGRANDAALRETFAGSDALVVGPNCVGFASFHESICAITQPVPAGINPGEVSVISQSGGLTGAAMGAIVGDGLGLDVCYSIGNGSVFGLAAAVRSAVERETTKVVAMVVESVDDPRGLEEAARLARERGKVIIGLQLGQSESGRGIAQSHTGAIAGEQRLVAAWLRRLGVVLADTAEEMGRIASLVMKLGMPDAGRGTFVATVSGGGAGLAADLAARYEVRLAQLEPETQERLRELLPDGAFIGNPLDVQTGDGHAVYTAITSDPNVELLIEPWMLPWPDDVWHWQRAALMRIVGIAEDAQVPLLVGSHFMQPLNEFAQELGRRPGVSVTTSLPLTMAALGKLYAAAGYYKAGPGAAAAALRPAESAKRAAPTAEQGSGLITEVEARKILTAAGLPVVKGVVASDLDELAAGARELTRPWVAKLVAEGVGHKGRVGGVRLGLSDEAALREGCEAIADAATAAGVATREQIAFLVTETEFGPELLIGALRDPVAGPTVTVAVGGWAAESGQIFGIVPLPVTREELWERVREWRLDHLLGDRVAGLVDFLSDLGDEFAGGVLAQYATVEINPLMLTDHGPSVVDALIVRGSA
jgi:acyl-CoA synthetase (NDP forming)